MAATLPGAELVGQSVIATAIPYEADGTTPTPSATVSSATWSITPAGIADMTTNADGTATFKAVAAGVATVSVTATVTDGDGVSATFTGTNTLTVKQPTGRSAGLQISFGVPA